MELPDPERRLIAQLQKSEQRWPRVRWFALVASAASILFYAFALWWFYSFAFQDVTDQAALTRIGVLASASPILWICFLFSSAWLGFTLRHWNGHAERRLFLKIISEHEKTNG